MWFVLLAIALAVVISCGIYFRRRVLEALEVLGVGRRPRKVAGLAILWLLFGVPALTFVSVLVSLAIGRESIAISVSGVIEWVIVFPFWFSVLAMLQTVPFLIATDGVSWLARRRVPRARRDRWRALACLGITGVFAVYTPLRVLLEHDALDVNHYQVGDGSGEPLRIVFLADLQADHHTDDARATGVARRVNESRPDLVLVGGDWINTGPDHIEAAGRAAGQLRARLGVASVIGDHEHFAYRDQDRSVREVTEALATHGVPIIDNQVRFLDHDGERLAIIYLSYNYIVRARPERIEALLVEADTADYSILVTHQFDNALARQVVDRVDLALVAHTHGGQVNPFVGIGHVSLARAETPYVAGRYDVGRTTLIVTSGIGFSIAPFRYAARASIEVIELRP